MCGRLKGVPKHGGGANMPLVVATPGAGANNVTNVITFCAGEPVSYCRYFSNTKSASAAVKTSATQAYVSRTIAISRIRSLSLEWIAGRCERKMINRALSNATTHERYDVNVWNNRERCSSVSISIAERIIATASLSSSAVFSSR